MMTSKRFRALLLYLLHRSMIAAAYTRFTVGGESSSSGWKIGVNYTAWASTQTFSLGDSLAFHYEPQHTVIHTRNFTTYQLCDASADDNSLQIWSSVGSTESIVVLSNTGENYFFCSAYDGEHCRISGMKFAIHVEFAQGLPISPSLPPEAGGDSNFPEFEIPPPPSPDPSTAYCTGASWAPAFATVLLYLMVHKKHVS